jgi:hypothetical protein
MHRAWLGALTIVFGLSIGGLIQPLIEHAPAATIVTGEDNGGTIGTGVETLPHAPQYGPVNQKAPLDFATQPRSVPRTYTAGSLYNIQVLKGGYGAVVAQMADFTQALGVGCEYCHNLSNFAYDTPTKKIARTMILMVGQIQANWVGPVHKDFPNFAVRGAVGCITCHRGSPVHPVTFNIVPVQYLDWPAKSTRQAGFVVNSMYSVAKSLGVNCLFCHNSADFVTLQSYPTNRIAHRMWQMVDAINHKYLPPNIEAVTCYTCHHGAKWPNQLVTGGFDQSPVQANAVRPEVHLNPGAHTASGVQ